MEMAALAQQLAGGLRCPPFSNTHLSKPISTKHAFRPRSAKVVSPVPVDNAQTRERLRLKEMFDEAYERCRIAPTEGVPFTVEDFHAALDNFDFNSELGAKVIPLFSLFFHVILWACSNFWILFGGLW